MAEIRTNQQKPTKRRKNLTEQFEAHNNRDEPVVVRRALVAELIFNAGRFRGVLDGA